MAELVGGPVHRVEVVTRGERRRPHGSEMRARLLAETLEPGATVAEVARRHSVAQSMLFRWRRAARLAAEQQAKLVPVRVGIGTLPVATVTVPGQVEVVLRNGRVLRVPADADLVAVARLAAALEA